MMRKLLFLLLLVGAGSQIQAQDTLRVMTYNILFYGASGPSGSSCVPTGVTARNSWFSTVMNATQPDIFGVNEIGPYNGNTSPAANILLNVLQPINSAYKRTNVMFTGNQPITNALYYNSDKVELDYQAVIAHPFRQLDYYKFYYQGPGLVSGDTTFVEVVLVHFSASVTSTQLSQAQTIMSYLNNFGRTGNFIIMGDMNLKTSNGGPFLAMTNHSNPNINMNDPINLSGNWTGNNANHSWSQSTRNSAGTDCGVGGGLDDRYDVIICSNDAMNASNAVHYIPGSYHVVGNPHSPNPSYSQAVELALTPLSDHLPVIMDMEVSRLVARDKPVQYALLLDVLGNPASGTLNLRVGAGSTFFAETVTLSLLSLHGQTILQTEVALNGQDVRAQISLAGIASGLYLLQARTESGVQVTKKVFVSGE